MEGMLMRVTIRPSAHPDQEIDITNALVGAVAAEIWKHCGGNDVLNWMEAERFVQALAAREPQPEPKSRQHVRPVSPSRTRDDAGRPTKRANEAYSERITGPLPLY